MYGIVQSNQQVMQRTGRAWYFRVGVSAVCAVVSVLLTVLWVRSYWRFEQLIHRVSATDYVAYTNIEGQFRISRSNDPNLAANFKDDWTWRTFAIADWAEVLRGPVAYVPVSRPNPSEWLRRLRHIIDATVQGVTTVDVQLPYWLLVFLVGYVGALPWANWPRVRFSVRTLLIVTALIAALLWVLVYAVR